MKLGTGFKVPKRPLKAVGINIYGGGFTLGVLKHFEVLGQWEEIKLGKRTFDLNFPGLHRPGDHNDWPVDELEDKVDFVYANPPCAPWSSANNHAGKTRESRFEDWRLSLTRHTMEAAIRLKPKVFICESVEAAYNIGRSHYDVNYVPMWMDQGYSVTFFMTDALLHGSYSARRRFHFIAHKHELDLGRTPTLDTALTVRDAIGDLADPRLIGKVPMHNLVNIHPSHIDIINRTAPGRRISTTLQATPDFKGPKVTFLIRKLAWDAPGPTILGTLAHPDQNRWTTLRELMRLCTYPDEFIAHNNVEAVDTVLPCMAEYLAGVAKRTINKGKPMSKVFSIVDWRALGKEHHPSRLLKARAA